MVILMVLLFSASYVGLRSPSAVFPISVSVLSAPDHPAASVGVGLGFESGVGLVRWLGSAGSGGRHVTEVCRMTPRHAHPMRA